MACRLCNDTGLVPLGYATLFCQCRAGAGMRGRPITPAEEGHLAADLGGPPNDPTFAAVTLPAPSAADAKVIADSEQLRIRKALAFARVAEELADGATCDRPDDDPGDCDDPVAVDNPEGA